MPAAPLTGHSLMAIDLTTAMIAATVEIDQPLSATTREVGTGFFVAAPRPDGTPRTVLVTAAHVFDNMPGSSIRVGYRFQGADGKWAFGSQPLTIRADARPLWVRLPDRDVAAIAVEAPPEFARAAIPLSWLATEDDLVKAGIGPGDEMFVLGFPEGLASNTQGFPILRSGRVASTPLTPIAQFPSFLLDFRVFSGNSGGPVFITSDQRRRPGPGAAPADFVAGMLAQQTMVGDERLELGIVLHAVFVRETIERLDLPGAPGGVEQVPSPPAGEGGARRP